MQAIDYLVQNKFKKNSCLKLPLVVTLSVRTGLQIKRPISYDPNQKKRKPPPF